MSDDVLITPASRKIEFFDNGGNIDGKIELDGSGNLSITSAGSIAIGDITQDIHVGDGTQAVDLVFDFTSSVYSVANQDLTIGKKSLGGNDILIESPSPVRVTTDGGYIDVGPANTGYAHIQTDRTRFYFNKPLIIDGGNTSGDAYLISSYTTEDFVIATNNGAEDRITIKQATGNVGINTTSPGHLLEVAGGGGNGEIVTNRTSGAEIKLQAQASTAVIGASSNHTLALMTNGSQRVKINNVGGIEAVSNANGWNLWHKVTFGKLDYGTSNGQGSGLSTLTFDDNEAGISTYTLPRDITIHAVEIRTQGVVLSGTTSQVLRIFANGNAGSGTLTDISYNASQFTRHNSENSNATQHSLVITGVNGSYNAGDTLGVRRNSGAVDMGDYIVDVWFSIDNA